MCNSSCCRKRHTIRGEPSPLVPWASLRLAVHELILPRVGLIEKVVSSHNWVGHHYDDMLQACCLLAPFHCGQLKLLQSSAGAPAAEVVDNSAPWLDMDVFQVCFVITDVFVNAFHTLVLWHVLLLSCCFFHTVCVCSCFCIHFSHPHCLIFFVVLDCT